MKNKKYQSADCIALLRVKYDELLKSGQARYPRRSDFSESEVVAIKAFFGPWPRALEAAGIKSPRSDGYALRKREKRLRAKRARVMYLKAKNHSDV